MLNLNYKSGFHCPSGEITVPLRTAETRALGFVTISVPKCFVLTSYFPETIPFTGGKKWRLASPETDSDADGPSVRLYFSSFSTRALKTESSDEVLKFNCFIIFL